MTFPQPPVNLAFGAQGPASFNTLPQFLQQQVIPGALVDPFTFGVPFNGTHPGYGFGWGGKL